MQEKEKGQVRRHLGDVSFFEIVGGARQPSGKLQPTMMDVRMFLIKVGVRSGQEALCQDCPQNGRCKTAKEKNGQVFACKITQQPAAVELMLCHRIAQYSLRKNLENS